MFFAIMPVRPNFKSSMALQFKSRVTDPDPDAVWSVNVSGQGSGGFESKL